MTTHAEPARKPAQGPAPAAAAHGAHADAMDAAPRVQALRATGHMLNARPAQRAEKSTGKPAGPELALLLDQLAATAEQVEEAGPQAGKQPSEQLLARTAKLHAVAQGEDEPAKQALLAALQDELGRAGPAPKAAQKPVQRVVDPLTIGLIVGGLVIGLGFLARRVYRYYQERAEDALLARFQQAAPGTLANPAIPDELTDGVADLLAPGARAARIFANLNNFRSATRALSSRRP
jgi:multisubunit Na+/H+ antiporter MnhC subunit